MVLTPEQGDAELAELRRYLKEVRKLEFRDAVILLVNFLVWSKVDITEIKAIKDDIQKIHESRKRLPYT